MSLFHCARKFKAGLILLLFLMAAFCGFTQNTTISEENIEFKTYPFSDPDPVPEIGRMYPYFYFHGYTNTPIIQKWKMVILENEFIKVYVCPDIGGKIWGAIEKSTGKEFLYFNHVVKFRDVAMRGAWTSGGLEYNFGDIGHIPTCATPVDYTIKENADGSVSCVVGAIDLPSGTKWNVEIKVSPGKAFFETKASWFNNTHLPCTYYHWMNAAAKAGDDLEFIYPGTNWIGHGDDKGDWPTENKREINWYKNNNFGSYKSYHVMNSYSDFFGGYWHNEDFGFGHYSDYDDKPGKKLWIWGLAQEGMIWEDLLSDTDGQYIEFQAGKLFNQAANSSTKTPFKHKEFAPHDADIMKEIWFPLKKTKGMVAASEFAVLNVINSDNGKVLLVSALQDIQDELKIYKNGKLFSNEKLKLKPLDLQELNLSGFNEKDIIKVVLGNNKLIYSSNKNDILVDRPISPNREFDWNSAYGIYTSGFEMEKQREFKRAKTLYAESLAKNPGFLPALNRLALSFYREMDYANALITVKKSLAIDSYNGEANYLLGLICRETGDATTAKSGFSIAMGNVAYRSAAATELAGLFLAEKNYSKAGHYSQKALTFNQLNIDAFQTLAVAKRNEGDVDGAKEILKRIENLDALNHFHGFETYILSNGTTEKVNFLEGISNELPHETFLDLAIRYYHKGCNAEAIKVLELAPQNSVISIWLAFLCPEQQNTYINDILDQSAQFVFPHRVETAKALKSLMKHTSHWKLNYYLGLIELKCGLENTAKNNFELCGEEPDFPAFYLAKAKLGTSNKKQLQCIEKAVELDHNSWRSAISLAKYYLSEESAVKAKKVIEPFLSSHPEQSAIGLCYAQCLSGEKKYAEAVNFLENYELLPFEGATIGRDLYNEVCIRYAFDALNRGKYKKAIQFAEKAKMWPVNLGVGRPFDVDERLADFILTKAYTARGDKANAGLFASKVSNYKHPGFRQENSKLILQLTILKDEGQIEQAIKLLDYFLNQYPESNYIKWVEAKFKEKPELTEIQEMIWKGSGALMVYDTKFVDKEFELLLDFLQSF